MKVANIIEEGRLAGPQLRILQVAARLKALGVETVVYHPLEDSGRFGELLDKNRVSRIALPLHRLGRGKKAIFSYLFWFFPEMLMFCKSLRAGGFDLVHVSGGAWQLKGVIAAKIAGVRVLWHLNDSSLPLLMNILFRFLSRMDVSGYIVSCERAKNYYLKNNFRKIPIFKIMPPVNTEYFCPKNPIKWDSMTPIKIITICNVNPGKGLEYFIDMAEILNQRYSNLNFAIVGPVYETQIGYKNKLDERIKEKGLDNLRFTGPSDDVRTILEESHILVCTSLAETGPMTVFEAMSMMKPVVSTDVGDVKAIIEENFSGYVVPVGDSRALAERVAVFLDDPSLAEAFGRRARERAESLLDISRAVAAHHDAYRAVVDGR